MDLKTLDTNFLNLGEVVQRYSEMLKKHGPNIRTNITEIKMGETANQARAVFAETDSLRVYVDEYAFGPNV